MSLLHDLGQFIKQDFTRRPGGLSYNTINMMLLVLHAVWVVLGCIAVIVLPVAFGPFWLWLIVPYLLFAIFLGRFGQYHAKKHQLRPWF